MLTVLEKQLIDLNEMRGVDYNSIWTPMSGKRGGNVATPAVHKQDGTF